MRRLVVSSALLLVTIAVLASESPRSEQKSPGVRAWDDLRFTMTAIEAYSTDNDGLYAPAGAAREGDVALFDEQLRWYYDNSAPKRANPPHTDPWGRPYRFALSTSGRLYALYSLGPDGKLDAVAADLIRRVKSGEIKAEELTKRQRSDNLVIVSGNVLLAPASVLQLLQPKG